MGEVVLHDYWRSSACYRVRIVLNLKGVAYRSVAHDIRIGEQNDPAYVARNPQGLVPMLSIDGLDLTQSLAIIDYLDAQYPDPPMVPRDPAARSGVLARALIVAADVHPLNNLRVLKYLKNQLGHDQAAIDDWYRHWVAEGFAALEAMAPDYKLFGGDEPDMADVCLVPQMYNARRLDLPLAGYPRLVRVDAALQALPAFAAAHPDRVEHQ